MARAFTSGVSAERVSELAGIGQLTGPDGRRLPKFLPSPSTVRRAAAELREESSVSPDGPAPGIVDALAQSEQRLLEELAGAWASFDERKADMKPNQIAVDLRNLAYLHRTVAKAVAEGTGPQQQPADSEEPGHEDDPEPGLLDVLAAALDGDAEAQDVEPEPERNDKPQSPGKSDPTPQTTPIDTEAMRAAVAAAVARAANNA